MMIAVQDTIVSDEVFSKAFVCDLSKCKGECCVAGDAGAPLEDDEPEVLEEIFSLIKPFMSEKGVKAIEKQGKYVLDEDGDLTTPLINGGECAYALFENGIAVCSIEKAYNAGVVSFKKPISCHLYPIRVSEHKGFKAVNYHKWQVCSPACDLGSTLKIPVYKFLKEPILRKFGEDYYKELEEVSSAFLNK